MKGFKGVNAYIYGKGIVKTDIGFEGDKIAYIGNDGDIEPICDIKGTVVAGFIDEHIHGAGGADAMDGGNALNTVSQFLAKEGTTGFLATTMTQSPENIKRALNAVGEIIKKNEFTGARVLGAHLEGPFISLKHVGAQPKEYVEKPSVESFKTYDKASGGNIKIVSLAPEVEGGEELVRYLSANGVVASLGHTDASYQDAETAIEWGAKSVTHTFNAQTGIHHRNIGVAGCALLSDKLNCELICDTIHVSVPAIKLTLKNKPKDKLTLITDSMRAKGLPDGESELGGQKVFVKNGEARLFDGTLAGSTLKMNIAVKNLVEKCGVSFTDAVDFATVNPAKNIGVFDKYGSIEKGKYADFTVLGDDFEVLLTVVGGKIVYKK